MLILCWKDLDNERRPQTLYGMVWLVGGYKLEFTGKETRRGRECIVAEIVRTSPASIRRARENSLSVKGARMFNLLPPYLRNISSDKVHHFKAKLDAFFKEVGDEPFSETEGRVSS